MLFKERKDSKVVTCVISAIIVGSITTAEGADLFIKMNGQTPSSDRYLIENQGSSAPSLRIIIPPLPAYTYDIFCIDGSGAGDIDQITTNLAPTSSGNVRIRIINPTTGAAGARNVNLIDISVLNSGNDYSSILNSRITGNLGSAHVVPDAANSAFAGYIDFSGGLPGDVTGTINAYQVNGLSIGGKLASGALIQLSGPFSSSINIAGPMQGNITLSSTSAASGTITVGSGSSTGTIQPRAALREL